MASDDNGGVLVVGNQRSYSDVCRNTVTRKAQSGILDFDKKWQLLTVKAGTDLYTILNAIRHDGFMLPVVPGTGWATVGGCIANDVHGKNHQAMGSFGNHLGSIKVNDTVTTPGEPLYAATIGGLGLTGEIKWAVLSIIPGKPLFPWLFPLDYIPGYWPFYKRMGFWQFHCVVPEEAVKPLMKQVTQRPLLLVKKRFGDIPSVGMLSFCRPGISVCMDFARKDEWLREQLERVVFEYRGAIYPAKTNMSPLMFAASFPRCHEFAKYVDPKFSSHFWRRVNG